MVKLRMKSNISKECYIQTAYHIILKEGTDALTIRRLAKELDCNKANLYRYFKGLDELTAYASLQFLQEYLKEIARIFGSSKDYLTLYYGIWNCFANYSFKSPEIFDNLFFGYHGESLDKIVKEYYHKFPEDMKSISEHDREGFLSGDFDYRNYIMLVWCAEAGVFYKKDIDNIHRLSIVIFKGYFKEILDKRRAGQEVEDDIVIQFMGCLKEVLHKYII